MNLSKHDITSSNRPTAEGGLSKSGSQIVLKETGIFLPVGAGEITLFLFYCDCIKLT